MQTEGKAPSQAKAEAHVEAEFVSDRVGAKLVGVGTTRFFEMQKEPGFPPPSWFGARAKRHHRDTLLEWARRRNEKPATAAPRPGDKVRVAASALQCALVDDLARDDRQRWERAGRPGLVELHRHKLVTGRALRRLGIALPLVKEQEHA